MNAIRISLLVAAIYDLAAAVLILVPVRAATDALGIPIGEPVMYFRFAGLLLAILPVFYFMGARVPRLAVPIAAGAVLARTAGVIFLGAHLLTGHAVAGFALFLAAEAFFGVWHWVVLGRAGVGLVAALRGAAPGPIS